MVGNKIDLLGNESADIEKVLQTLTLISKNVELCMGISSKSLNNIKELFNCAQRVVLHPTAPLYDTTSKQLTPNFVRCCKFVFRKFDADNDFVWSDSELSNFQNCVYRSTLSKNDIIAIRKLIQSQNDNWVT